MVSHPCLSLFWTLYSSGVLLSFSFPTPHPVVSFEHLFPHITPLFSVPFYSCRCFRIPFVNPALTFNRCPNRCRYLARCYAPLKRYAESLTLTQHATIHLRETNSLISLLSDDPINSLSQPFFPLTPSIVTSLEEELSADSLQFKKDWFTFNGGAVTSPSGPGSEAQQPKTYKKPLFYDIALNYIQLDMERLQERAGKTPETLPAPTGTTPKPQPIQSGPVQKQAEPEKKAGVSLSKTVKVEEVSRPSTPEPSSAVPVRSGLSSLLGGWWGRK